MIHLLPLLLAAQAPQKPDTARTSRDTLEAVTVRAMRAPAAAPAPQHTVTRADIQRGFAGQDAPNYITSTPSAISYSEAGGFSGYSYIRLRGIDQTRLNISVDGIPLNDPEDQVLYFSNVPDFLNSIESVQIQRGVGASGFGTASFAGSLNFRSIPLATTPRGGALDITAGSFATRRAAAQFATGVMSGGWAAYGRVSKLDTEGYRRHSGNDAQSAFVSVGHFGERDAIKFTGFAGSSGTRLAYLATAEDDLKADRRTNYLGTDEGDRFHQEMASLQYSRSLGEGLEYTLTAYRNSAGGSYDVRFDSATMANYALAHVWLGGLAALQWHSGNADVSVGAHVSDYHREHALAYRPDLSTREYDNTGKKNEESAFAKFAYQLGDLRLFADVEGRHATFDYQPSNGAGVQPASTSWSFFNPKAGASWNAGRGLVLFASFGRTSREPARGDLFAGADDLNSTNSADILPLSRVRPESVNDYEGGFSWSDQDVHVTANVFAMEFRNEIAAIGKLSLTGSPLRQNVAESYRRGVELDGTWRASDRVSVGGNVTLMKSRIAVYHDESSNATYYDVEPVMTPPVIANARVDVKLAKEWSLGFSPRYVDRAHLANDGNDALVTPAYFLLDGGLTWRRDRLEVRFQAYNLLDAHAEAGGYAGGGLRYFYPVAARNGLVNFRIEF